MPKNYYVWSVCILSMFLLASNASAARVAVVIETPGGTDAYKKCLTVAENANAYDILKKTGVDITWSVPGPWGHGLCAVNGTGCEANNCFCNPDDSWNFYTMESGMTSWSFTQKGFDSGDSCTQHYCAKDGDSIALTYGPYGTAPKAASFKDICLPRITQEADYTYTVALSPDQIVEKEGSKVIIKDYSTRDGIRDVEAAIYKADKKITSGTTDKNGEFAFTIETAGTYSLKINVKGYERPQRTISFEVVSAPKATTTTTTSTSTTQEDTTTTLLATTTTKAPTTTTTTSTTTTTTTSTTTTSPTTTTTTLADAAGIIGNAIGKSIANPGPIVLILVLAIGAYYSFTFYRKKKARKK